MTKITIFNTNKPIGEYNVCDNLIDLLIKSTQLPKKNSVIQKPKYNLTTSLLDPSDKAANKKRAQSIKVQFGRKCLFKTHQS